MPETAFWQGRPGPFSHDDLISTEGNRWNIAGEPTVYLAGDLGLVLVEAGRHLPPGSKVEPRVLWTARVDTRGLLDLRHAYRKGESDCTHALWFLERSRTRRVASRLRAAGAPGLIVPCAGSPDDLSRVNLVLFADRLERPLESTVLEPRAIGRIDAWHS